MIKLKVRDKRKDFHRLKIILIYHFVDYYIVLFCYDIG